MLAKRRSWSFSHELLPHEVNTAVFLFTQTELSAQQCYSFTDLISIAQWLKLMGMKEMR